MNRKPEAAPAAGKLLLPHPVQAALAAAAAAAWPQEACGLLLGRRQPGQVQVDAFAATRNAAADPRSGYLVPPLELLAADHEARRYGREIVAIWHSHPDAPARPSQRDVAEAWRGYPYGIQAATRAGAGELRFFELAPAAGPAAGIREWQIELVAETEAWQ